MHIHRQIHEPIFDRNLIKIYDLIKSIKGFLSAAVVLPLEKLGFLNKLNITRCISVGRNEIRFRVKRARAKKISIIYIS